MDNEMKETALDRIESLLKAELSLTLRLYEQAETQKKALKENLNGKAVSEATEAINKTLRELDANENNKKALLTEMQADDIEAVVGRMPYSQEKTRVRQQMKRLGDLLEKMRGVVESSRSLLKKDMEYLNFSLNVMTAASAAPAYGTPDAPEQATQGRKLFDQSI